MDTVDKTINAIEGKRRSMIAAYVLWFFVGTLGIHRLYLGHKRSGLIMLAATVTGWLLVRIDWWRSGTAFSTEAIAGSELNPTLVTMLLAPKTALGWLGDLMILGVFFWWLADAFLTYTMVRRRNGDALVPASIAGPLFHGDGNPPPNG